MKLDSFHIYCLCFTKSSVKDDRLQMILPFAVVTMHTTGFKVEAHMLSYNDIQNGDSCQSCVLKVHCVIRINPLYHDSPYCYSIWALIPSTT
jgi:hypothetical protein